MKWVTRERPKIDRIACPWLIARFIDKEPEFLYVPSSAVLEVAEKSRSHAAIGWPLRDLARSSPTFADDHEMLHHGQVI